MWCEFYKQEVSEQTCCFCSVYCSKRKCDETKAINKIHSVDDIKPEDEAEEVIECEMEPITELYRIVEGALKDNSNMIMRYVKRLIDRFAEDKSMDIDWDKTEKGIQEILNAYNNRSANIATLDEERKENIL